MITIPNILITKAVPPPTTPRVACGPYPRRTGAVQQHRLCGSRRKQGKHLQHAHPIATTRQTGVTAHAQRLPWPTLSVLPVVDAGDFG